MSSWYVFLLDTCPRAMSAMSKPSYCRGLHKKRVRCICPGCPFARLRAGQGSFLDQTNGHRHLCWNGDTYVLDRVKFNGEPLRIEHASLSIIGGMVPDRLRGVLADSDDGLVERMLFVWPEPAPIAPLCDRGSTDAAERRAKLQQAAERLHTLKMGVDNNGTAAPCALSLDTEARKLFDEQRQEQMQLARAASGLAAGWHGKNLGRLLRLALAFELLAWGRATMTLPSPQARRDNVQNLSHFRE
jgi:hypothetical protein